MRSGLGRRLRLECPDFGFPRRNSVVPRELSGQKSDTLEEPCRIQIIVEWEIIRKQYRLNTIRMLQAIRKCWTYFGRIITRLRNVQDSTCLPYSITPTNKNNWLRSPLKFSKISGHRRLLQKSYLLEPSRMLKTTTKNTCSSDTQRSLTIWTWIPGMS